MKGLTPYQGRNRVFGKFNCYKCGREWSSKHSWANTPQLCNHCTIFIYPDEQYELHEINDNKNKNKNNSRK